MILDSLNNTKKIECLHPLFKKAFDYLKSTDFSKVEDGKHELDGSRLYMIIAGLYRYWSNVEKYTVLSIL